MTTVYLVIPEASRTMFFNKKHWSRYSKLVLHVFLWDRAGDLLPLAGPS